ncbi:MAG: DoxX family protein [Bacteroidetes bacterium]|nr:MAG: DoxX family protein [Bacteroidota bacterium]
MKYLRLIARILIGIVFVFSGFVKAVDPLGFTYKFGDYFTAFRLGFLDFLSLPLGIALPAMELALGVLLILGYRRRFMYWLLFAFMAFFSLLTLVLALFNPVHDCGCFGDAVVLSNWQTFLKNVLLMLPTLFLFLGRHREEEHGHAGAEWLISIFLFFGLCLFSVWNLRHIPVLDFRPYDLGTLIEEDMRVPEGAPVDRYETTLVYRNRESGKEESFGLDDYPRDTLAWTFVSSDSKLIEKGYEAPIHDFALVNDDGEDQVDQILADEDYSLLMLAYDLHHSNPEFLRKANDWAGLELLADDFRFYAVTATVGNEAAELAAELGLAYDFYAADEIMLKTIVRSNPGFMLIKNGVIVGKWAGRDFPSLLSIDPSLPEQIENATVPMDQDSQLLEEAGVWDDFSFATMKFDRYAQQILAEENAADAERRLVLLCLLGGLVLVLIARIFAPLHL